MKRSLFIAVVAVVAICAGAWLYAQSPGNPKVVSDAPGTAVVAAPPTEITALRQRFLGLSEKRAHQMTAAELRSEIETLERKLEADEAWAKVDEAGRLLRDVAEKHPNTPAAHTAKQIVHVIENRRQLREGVRGPGPETFEAVPPRDDAARRGL